MTDVRTPVTARQPVLLRWLLGALTALVAITMFAMMMLTTIDVGGRALINKPIKGSDELVSFMLAILVFASLPLVTWDEKHISVNLFDRWIPAAVRRPLVVLLSAVSAVVMIGVAWRMWIQGRLMWEGQHITGALEWPIAPIAFVMSALSAVTAAMLIVIAWRKLRGLGRPPDGDGNAGAG